MNADTSSSVPAPAKPIVKGSVVKYGDGYYRVSARYSRTVNLSGVFTSFVHHKSVPVDQVVEAHDEWYEKWTQSETYQSM
jgi:hypothetical protein